jgi:2-polyprenyl-6-methoxyphenol hydroxylase-like FAD-dependent oxidoreductase
VRGALKSPWYRACVASVLIAGAGPAGATLAYLLARRGIEVVLLERQRDFEREFRGEVLMPSAFDGFAQMGLAGEVSAIPQVVLRGARVFLRGRELFTVDLDAGELGGRAAWISQPRLLELLVAQAARFPSFRFEPGAALRELIREDGRVVGARMHGATGERELRADLVVGADGRASIVRRELGVAVRRDKSAMDVVWCKVPLPDWLVGEARLRGYLGRGHFAIVGPTPDGSLQLGWVIGKGRFGELRARGIDDWVDALAGHVDPELAAHLRAQRAAISRPFLLDVVADRVEPWCAAGALLIGDAAHTMSPVGAQGLNIAIRDALVAANELVPALEAGADPRALDAAAARVEAERLPEVRQIQFLQSLPPRVALRDAWWAPWLIRLAPRLLVGRRARGPVVRRFARGVTKVTLRV